jgi:hypothetical protein
MRCLPTVSQTAIATEFAMSRFFQSLKAKFTQSRTSRSSRRGHAPPRRTWLSLETMESRVVPAHAPIVIQFDYSLDASGWFSDASPSPDPNDGNRTLGQQRRAVLQEAADDLTGRLGDHLTAIPLPPSGSSWTVTLVHPGTNSPTPEQANDLTKRNLTVPERTLRIYAGSRDLPADVDGRADGGNYRVSLSWSNPVEEAAARAWENTVRGRGQPGALGPAADQDDVAPWGGTIAFDPNTAWNYEAQTGNFYNVAQHEIGHLLGITLGFTDDTGTYQPSVWENNVTNGAFTGDAAMAANNGTAVPVIHDENGAHFQNDVESEGRQVTMARTGNGTARGFTALDFAALDDIGWDLIQPPMIPVTVRIPELVQFESPDDGLFEDGDYYIQVTINGVQHRNTDEKSPDGDDEPFDPGWSFTQPVPSNLTSVPIKIQIYDSDGLFNFQDNEMDISAAAGHLGIDLSVSLVDGHWEGGASFPFFYPTNETQGNGEGDGRIKIKFNIEVASSVARGLVVDAAGGLTVQGDQFATNPDDDVTFDRTASGGLKVALNGHVVEYAAGAIAGIVVNTGLGSNTITMLSTFPGIPVTINGGGTDRLTFGPGLPAPGFTPAANSPLGDGTLTVGGALIHLRGLEFVDGVAPDVTGVQLTSVTVDENGVATVTGTFTDPGSYSTHSLAINWGDGTSDPVSRLALGERSFTATHRYLDDNPTGTTGDAYTITATVTDNDNLGDSATATVTVGNVAPRLANVAVTPETDENGGVTLSGDIVDPGTQDTFTLVVDWGEGTPQTFSYPAGTTHFRETHRYLDDNPTGTPQDAYAIGLTLTDDDAGRATAAASTRVRNVAPVFTTLGTSSTSGGPARESEPVTISGAFADVGPLDTHTVTVDWGDGAVTPAALTEADGSGNFSAQHAYSSGGIYPVLVTLRDDDTGEVTRVKTVFVTGVGVHVVGGRTSLQVVGTTGPDRVTINQQGNGGVQVHADFLAGGKRVLPRAGLDIIQVVVLAGDDHVSVAGSVDLPAVIDGGDGDDVLNGSNAGSIVIGGRGADHLNAGNARDTLIGGPGADRLVGNGGDDILVGGVTLYDSGADDDKLANDLILLQLRDEWDSARAHADRVANLRGGVGPVLGGTGLRLRQDTTVFGDPDSDVLTGSAGLDWFFFGPLLDSLNGHHAGEETN